MKKRNVNGGGEGNLKAEADGCEFGVGSGEWGMVSGEW